MWHHATYRGDELIVLGYHSQRNDCMLVKLAGLPMNEQSELRKIAGSRSAQASSYLIPILRKMESPFGVDWFSYLAKKMEQRNGPVFTLPLKEIQDSLDSDQKAIFKGYGKGRKNSLLEVENLGREYDPSNANNYLADEDQDHDLIREPRQQVQRPQADVRISHGSDTATNLDYKIDLLIETVSGENRQTQQLLNKLLTVLASNASITEKRTRPVKQQPLKPRRIVAVEDQAKLEV